MWQSFLKFLFGFFVLVTLGAASLFGVSAYARSQNSNMSAAVVNSLEKFLPF